MLAPRLRAVLDLTVPEAREQVGLHDYDGEVRDLSPDGVRAGLAALGGAPLDDAHDEAHLRAFEELLRVELGELEGHRWNPLWHIENLDLSDYAREYAPAEQRAEARRRHLAAWPDAVDAAIEALDRVPCAVARGLLGAAEGLAAALDPEVDGQALAAHQRFVEHLRRSGADGVPDPRLGAQPLTRLFSAAEASAVDLGRLAEQADAEQRRLRGLLADACAVLHAGLDLHKAVARLTADHPASGDGVLAEARELTAEVIAFTRVAGLVPDYDGECRVGPTPPARSWSMAMLTPAAPFEPDGPSWYHVTPPDPAWTPQQRDDWLAVFNRSALPAITAHEVAPGHFTHGRFLRAAPSDVRKSLQSYAFTEGWAHDMEELMLEEGFRDGDARYAAGVAIEGLIRTTRLAVAIGVHSADMTVAEAERRFMTDAFLGGPAARSEAARATFDPRYGSYTWGKLALRRLRDEARRAWGAGYSHRRFHAALLALGAPPLGLAVAALDGSRGTDDERRGMRNGSEVG